MRPHAELKPEDVTVIVDTREQLPFDLAPLKINRRALDTGDYSILGLEELVVVERKSLPDLLLCVGRERERFDREMQRILAYPSRLLVIEADWATIELGEWQSRVHPNAVLGSLLSWSARGMNVWCCASRREAQTITARFLFAVARRRWRELQSFIPNLKIAGGE
jgi:ERCC4-type nuclease